jgi:hypothetical protein
MFESPSGVFDLLWDPASRLLAAVRTPHERSERRSDGKVDYALVWQADENTPDGTLLGFLPADPVQASTYQLPASPNGYLAIYSVNGAHIARSAIFALDSEFDVATAPASAIQRSDMRVVALLLRGNHASSSETVEIAARYANRSIRNDDGPAVVFELFDDADVPGDDAGRAAERSRVVWLLSYPRSADRLGPARPLLTNDRTRLLVRAECVPSENRWVRSSTSSNSFLSRLSAVTTQVPALTIRVPNGLLGATVATTAFFLLARQVNTDSGPLYSGPWTPDDDTSSRRLSEGAIWTKAYEVDVGEPGTADVDFISCSEQPNDAVRFAFNHAAIGDIIGLLTIADVGVEEITTDGRGTIPQDGIQDGMMAFRILPEGRFAGSGHDNRLSLIKRSLHEELQKDPECKEARRSLKRDNPDSQLDRARALYCSGMPAPQPHITFSSLSVLDAVADFAFYHTAALDVSGVPLLHDPNFFRRFPALHAALAHAPSIASGFASDWTMGRTEPQSDLLKAFALMSKLPGAVLDAVGHNCVNRIAAWKALEIPGIIECVLTYRVVPDAAILDDGHSAIGVFNQVTDKSLRHAIDDVLQFNIDEPEGLSVADLKKVEQLHNDLGTFQKKMRLNGSVLRYHDFLNALDLIRQTERIENSGNIASPSP